MLVMEKNYSSIVHYCTGRVHEAMVDRSTPWRVEWDGGT